MVYCVTDNTRLNAAIAFPPSIFHYNTCDLQTVTHLWNYFVLVEEIGKSSLHSTELLGKYGDTLFLHFSSESNGQYLKLQVALGISPNEEGFKFHKSKLSWKNYLKHVNIFCDVFLNKNQNIYVEYSYNRKLDIV